MKITALENELPSARPEDFESHAVEEARVLYGLYAAGIVRETHFRADQNEAVLIIEASSCEEAEECLSQLPSVEAGLIDFTLIPLRPYPGFERLFAGAGRIEIVSEHEIIERTGNQPITVDSLRQDFIQLGVQPGMTLLVHSSLSSLGWVSGGPVAVILALEEVLGESGTLVMPTHSGDLSDPADWENPPVPTAWWETIRETMPAFVPELTPARGIGIIPEVFRKQKGVERSEHPQVSFAARGPEAKRIVAGHRLDYGLGESSPLAKVYGLGGWILLLGVGHASNTSLHLAEYRAEYDGKREIRNGAPILRAGQRVWVETTDLDLDTEDFERIGEDFLAETGKTTCGKVGLAETQLIPQRDLVDYAVKWMEHHR